MVRHKSKHVREGRFRVGLFIAKGALWSILPIVLAVIVYIGFFRPLEKQPKVIVVSVRPGLNTAQIADELVEAGVITNAYTFRVYAAMTQTESKLQPGKYKFKTGMTYYDILKKLTERPRVKLVTVVIPEGYTASRIAERLAGKTDRPAADFLEYIRGRGAVEVRPPELAPELNTVEGYLFPKTYTFNKKEHPRKIIMRMIKQFEEEVAGVDWAYAKQKNLTPHQIITVASLIEAEAKVPEERTLIAAVIYNRLDKGIPLQIDATVQYALPHRKEFLTNDDLKIASPYNTYQQIGLPPGPIANPGIESIKAALSPASVDYIYYVLTSPDGQHTFTNNYNDFLAAKRKAQGN